MKNLALAVLAVILIFSFKPATVRPVTKSVIVNSLSEAKDVIEYETRIDFRVVSMVSNCAGAKCQVLIVFEKSI